MGNLLHKSKLGAFTAWLDSEGIPYKHVAHQYQVIQVRIGLAWVPLYARLHSPEHYSVEERMVSLVIKFIAATRKVRIAAQE
jgi:hypothetical protein